MSIEPPITVSGSPSAALYYVIKRDHRLSAEVRNTCLVALAAIGRCRWNNSHTHLRGARKNKWNWSATEANCYSSVVKWAAMSGALSQKKFQRFVTALDNGTSAPGAANIAAERYLYNDRPTVIFDGSRMPPVGAMVFHGRGSAAECGKGSQTHHNAISHVTLYVGNGWSDTTEGMVVGCWTNAFMDSKEARVIQEDLMGRSLPACTVMTSMSFLSSAAALSGRANGEDFLAYTPVPFWENMP